MFRPGEEVVCIDDTIHFDAGDVELNLEGLKQGEHYHIRWVGMLDNDIGKCIMGYEPDVFYVRVAEIKRTEVNGVECPYFSWRFAPLHKTKKKTSIEVLKKLTRPVRIREDA